ncbi:MAG TPA: hypothetical protein VGI78_14100 [Acetobacteraceae bacterium]|jgi:hypothetical protein
MASAPRLHRVILHLRHGAAERVTIRAAAELAQMLGVALHGVFLEDDALPELATLPFIREFRLGTGSWERLDRQRLAEEQRSAAAEARRLLDEAAAALGITRLFEIISGDPALFVAATSQAGDIIVVAQPRLPAEGLVHATARWLEAAHGCAASVMLVPQALARRTGPVATVVCAESDPALGSAARIAVAAGETLLLLIRGTPELAKAAVEQARAAGLPSRRIITRFVASVTPEAVVHGLGASSERLVVLARGACGTDNAAVSAHIAASRGVPVLVVEP